MQGQTRSISFNDENDSERSSSSSPTRSRVDTIQNVTTSEDEVESNAKNMTSQSNRSFEQIMSLTTNDDQRSSKSLIKQKNESSSVSIAYKHAKLQQVGASAVITSTAKTSKKTKEIVAASRRHDNSPLDLIQPRLMRHNDAVTPGAVAVGGQFTLEDSFSRASNTSSGDLQRENSTIIAEVVDPHEDMEQQVRHITDQVLTRLRENVVDAEVIGKANRPDDETSVSSRKRIFCLIGCLVGTVVVAVVIAVAVSVATRKQSAHNPMLNRTPTLAPSMLLTNGSSNATNSSAVFDVANWETCRQGVDTCADFWSCCVAPQDVATNKTTCRPPGGGSCFINIIANWATCTPGADICASSWFCCVAPADISTNKTTCRPGGTACAGNLIPNWSNCRKGLDYCGNNDICRVAPADVSSGTTTCRPL